METLTAFQRDCLAILRGLDGPSGVELLSELEQYYNDELHSARLHPALDDLHSRGLITKSRRDGRTFEYRLSAQGRTLLHRHRKWQNSVMG